MNVLTYPIVTLYVYDLGDIQLVATKYTSAILEDMGLGEKIEACKTGKLLPSKRK
jgi:hypothetical protein